MPGIRLFLLALAATLPFPASPALPTGRDSPAEEPAGLIVSYQEVADPRTIALHADSEGVRWLESERIGMVSVQRPSDIESMQRRLMASGLVAYVEPNWRRQKETQPDDPEFNLQWALHNTGPFSGSGSLTVVPGADLDMLRAWSIQTGDSSVIVAVIDDGVDLNHPDLRDNIIEGRCFAAVADFCASPSDARPRTSSDSHGTLVASQVGARGNNGIGITGVAQRVTILPIRVDLRLTSIVQAIDYAISAGAHIINASYGGSQFSQAEFDAIARAGDAGILFVTSAGNADTDNDRGRMSFPQTYDLPNIVSVAAGSASDGLTPWAQYGQTTVDVTAGGERIRAANASVAGGGYRFASGSSFASPLVAGIAALIRSEFPGATWQEMKARIIGGAELPDALKARTVAGRANAYHALTDALDQPVLIIGRIGVDDSAQGNNNGMLDAGETGNLQVRLESLWGTATGLTAILSLDDAADGSVLTIGNALATAASVAPGAPATLAFPVTVTAGLSGNFHVLFRLDLADAGGLSITRWFRHELGLIAGNTTLTTVIGERREDKYHHFHIDVPPAATQFRITTETKNDYDIDLLARFGQPPTYQIALNVDPESGAASFNCGPDDEVRVSGAFNGNERIDWPGTVGNCVRSSVPTYNLSSGTYHFVIVNFGLAQREYRVSTTWCTAAGCPGQIRFSTPTFTAASGNSVAVVVRRAEGALGAASVRLRPDIGGNAIAGADYASFDALLQWADGDMSDRSFTIQLNPERATNVTRTLDVRLDDPQGATLLFPSYARVTLPMRTATVTPPPQPPSSGGGGRFPLWGVLLLLALALHRRTRMVTS